MGALVVVVHAAVEVATTRVFHVTAEGALVVPVGLRHATVPALETTKVVAAAPLVGQGVAMGRLP